MYRKKHKGNRVQFYSAYEIREYLRVARADTKKYSQGNQAEKEIKESALGKSSLESHWKCTVTETRRIQKKEAIWQSRGCDLLV